MLKEVVAQRQPEFGLDLRHRLGDVDAVFAQEARQLVIDRERILDHAGGNKRRIGREELERSVGTRFSQPRHDSRALTVKAQRSRDVGPVAVLGTGDDEVLDPVEPREGEDRDFLHVLVILVALFLLFVLLVFLRVANPGNDAGPVDRGEQLRAFRVALRQPAVQARADERVGGAIPVCCHRPQGGQRSRRRGEVVGDPQQQPLVLPGGRIQVVDDVHRRFVG